MEKVVVLSILLNRWEFEKKNKNTGVKTSKIEARKVRSKWQKNNMSQGQSGKRLKVQRSKWH